MEASFVAFCTLLAPSNSSRSTTPWWSVFWLLRSFVSLISDIIGFKSPAIYLASFFPLFAISLVQSTMLSNANGLFGLDPKKNLHWYFLDSGAIAKQCHAKDFRLFQQRPHLLIIYWLINIVQQWSCHFFPVRRSIFWRNVPRGLD